MVLPTMTCFEPETKGQLIEGTQFHQFMFESSSKLITKTEIVHDSTVDLEVLKLQNFSKMHIHNT